MERASSFNKNTLKKATLKKYMFIDLFKEIFHIRIFIKFHQRNVLEVKLKLLVFSPVPSVMQKVQKVESVNTQNDYKTKSRK